MSRPIAYSPEYGQRFQILVMVPGQRSYDHLDYAVDRAELKYLKEEYRIAYGPGYTYKTIELPKKYWNETK